MIVIGEKINGSIPSVAEEVETLKWMIDCIQEVTDLPISVDSPSPAVLAQAYKFCKRPGIFNSLSGEGNKIETIFPLMAEPENRGWQVIALLSDDTGIPKCAADRLRVFDRIMARAKEYGIAPERIHIDPLAEMLCTSENGIETNVEVIQCYRENPDAKIICLSALLTTTMSSLRDTVVALNAEDFRENIKIMVVGAQLGFIGVAPLECSTIELRPEVRQMCAANTCHMYDRCWSCPPGCGSLEECREKVSRYRQGILVQTVGILEDDLDGEGMMETEARHKEHFYAFEGILRNMFPDMLAMGAVHHCIYELLFSGVRDRGSSRISEKESIHMEYGAGIRGL